MSMVIWMIFHNFNNKGDGSAARNRGQSNKISEPSIYPTDQNKNYPSNKEGMYGFVIQLNDDNGPQPTFARHRGEAVSK